jgi:hypothetical protein
MARIKISTCNKTWPHFSQILESVRFLSAREKVVPLVPKEEFTPSGCDVQQNFSGESYCLEIEIFVGTYTELILFGPFNI